MSRMVPGVVDALDKAVAPHTPLVMLSVKQEHPFMAMNTRRLYRSANGDRWDLARDTATGRIGSSGTRPMSRRAAK